MKKEACEPSVHMLLFLFFCRISGAKKKGEPYSASYSLGKTAFRSIFIAFEKEKWSELASARSLRMLTSLFFGYSDSFQALKTLEWLQTR
ncbi:hypothetical protein ACKA0G_12585 [Priestia megaterium]